jgi:DNA-directed RNA polymerase sigma subunit (sigma70/sigma32)
MDENPLCCIQMVLDGKRLDDLLRSLSPIQEKVVRLYFGLGCQRSHTAAEIAAEFQVAPRVICDILSEAERQLRQGGVTPSELGKAGCAVVEVSAQGHRSCRHCFGGRLE